MSLLTKFAVDYVDAKKTVDAYAEKYKQSVPSKIYTEAGNWITYLSNNFLHGSPTEALVHKTVSAHLSKVASAFGFAAVMYDSSWCLNAATSLVLQKFQEPTADITERKFIRDASVALTAWHTVKLLENTWKLLSAPSLPTVAGIVYDAAALVLFNAVISDKKEKPVVIKID